MASVSAPISPITGCHHPPPIHHCIHHIMRSPRHCALLFRPRCIASSCGRPLFHLLPHVMQHTVLLDCIDLPMHCISLDSTLLEVSQNRIAHLPPPLYNSSPHTRSCTAEDTLRDVKHRSFKLFYEADNNIIISHNITLDQNFEINHPNIICNCC